MPNAKSPGQSPDVSPQRRPPGNDTLHKMLDYAKCGEWSHVLSMVMLPPHLRARRSWASEMTSAAPSGAQPYAMVAMQDTTRKDLGMGNG